MISLTHGGVRDQSCGRTLQESIELKSKVLRSVAKHVCIVNEPRWTRREAKFCVHSGHRDLDSVAEPTSESKVIPDASVSLWGAVSEAA